MATKKISYTEAFAQLTEILEKIEDGNLDVDNLTSNVKKASELLKLCKKKLYDTEEEIEKILDELSDEE